MAGGASAGARMIALAVVVGVLSGCGAASDSTAGTPARGVASAPDVMFSYAPFARLLLQHVNMPGMVDYRGLQNDRADLDAFVAGLGVLERGVYEGWTNNDKIAFWINAYNGLTLRAIVDHYPIKASVLRSLVYPENSIRQIPGVWKKLEFQVMGRGVTLDHIEHGILRREFDEPRIHMALVCAARSCPPLRWEPYDGERLDAQLEDQSVRFLGHPEKFRIDRERGRVELSSIFKWFGEDFIGAYGTDRDFERYGPGERAVLGFIAEHLEGRERDYLEQGSYELEYVSYDWTLNDTSDESSS